MGNNKKVSVQISELFFENIFEPERKKLEKQIGSRVTQVNFTEFLAKKKVKFVFPKQRGLGTIGRRKRK